MFGQTHIIGRFSQDQRILKIITPQNGVIEEFYFKNDSVTYELSDVHNMYQLKLGKNYASFFHGKKSADAKIVQHSIWQIDHEGALIAHKHIRSNPEPDITYDYERWKINETARMQLPVFDTIQKNMDCAALERCCYSNKTLYTSNEKRKQVAMISNGQAAFVQQMHALKNSDVLQLLDQYKKNRIGVLTQPKGISPDVTFEVRFAI